MKSVKSGDAFFEHNASAALAIVEICGLGPHDKNPLTAIAECDEELPIDFLERLARRPERILLLQCSCRLGCDGSCDCTKSLRGSERIDLWHDFSDKQQQQPPHLHPTSSEDPDSIPLLSREEGLGGQCLCKGLPRLNVDMMRCLNRFVPRETDLKLDRFSAMLYGRSWFRSSSKIDHCDPSKRINSWEIYSKKRPWVDALKSFNEILIRKIRDLPEDEMPRELSAVFMDLASYLILNISNTRSLGVLSAYFPLSQEETEKLIERQRWVFVDFFKTLIPLQDALNEDTTGEQSARFCIDLANLIAKRLVRYKGTKLKKMTTLGDAMIFATLTGGFYPSSSNGSGIQQSVSGTQPSGTQPSGTQQSGGVHQGGSFRNYSGFIESDADTYYEVYGHQLEKFAEILNLSSLPFDKGIISDDIYQIRCDHGIYHKAEDGSVEQIMKSFMQIPINDKKPNPWVLSEEKLFYSEEVTSQISESPLFYFERMEDLYQFKRSCSKGWRTLLAAHPYLLKELEMPRECVKFLQDDGRHEEDIKYAKFAQKYFETLSEDPDMIGQRKLISQSFLQNLTKPTAKWVFEDPLPRFSKHDRSVDADFCSEFRVLEAADFVARRIERIRGRGLMDEDSLNEISSRLEILKERYQPDDGKDYIEDETENLRAAHAYRDLVADLDLDYLFFVQTIKSVKKTKNLLSAAPRPYKGKTRFSSEVAKTLARHYSLSNRGLEILRPLPLEALGEERREAELRKMNQGGGKEPAKPTTVAVEEEVTDPKKKKKLEAQKKKSETKQKKLEDKQKKKDAKKK